MAKQLFLNNFESVFVGPVKDAPSSGTPDTELDYGILRLSDGAAGTLTNPTGGDYYVLTAYKRVGTSESNIEIMRVTAVDNATPGECRITVQRAQEGTSAKAYVSGDRVALRWTKGGAQNMAQPDDLATKEPVIAAPVSTPTEKYWRGDKTWRDFFTDVRAATLTGLSTATNAAVAATDTVLAAIGKLQAQVSAKFDKTGGDISGNVNIPSLNGGQLAGFRNKIINGACEVYQRGNTPVVLGVWTYGGADRIAVLPAGFSTASGTIFQTFGFVSSYRGQGVVLTTTGSGSVNFETRLEGRDVVDLYSKTVTFSVRVFQDTGAAVNVTLTLTKANAEDNFTSKTTIASSVPVSVATSTATYLTLTVPLGSSDASNGLSCQVNFTGVGAVTSRNFMTSEWQLEVGSVATPFERRPYGMELAMCQRYYYRQSSQQVNGRAGLGMAATTTISNILVDFPVTMRSEPNALEQSGSAGDYAVLTDTTVVNCNSVPTFAISTNKSAVVNFVVASGLTVGRALFGLNKTTSGFLGFSAEL